MIENDIANSNQRYQTAVQESKVRLDLAIAPNVLLMPSNLIINTESVVGYNNKLMRATEDMKFGVNNSLNIETKTVGITHSLGTSKVLLNTNNQPRPKLTNSDKSDEVSNIETSSHQNTLIVLMLAGGLLSWFLFR